MIAGKERVDLAGIEDKGCAPIEFRSPCAFVDTVALVAEGACLSRGLEVVFKSRRGMLDVKPSRSETQLTLL